MKKNLLLVIAIASLLLAACSSDGSSDGADAGDSSPTSGLYGSSDDAADADADASAAIVVETASSDLGDILVDGDGFTLYGFTPDLDAGAPTCTDGCTGAWPPVFVDGDELPDGLDPELFSLVEHPSGTNQLQVGDVPLYLFSGDAAAGDTTGQGSGDTWFVVAPDGTLIQ